MVSLPFTVALAFQTQSFSVPDSQRYPNPAFLRDSIIDGRWVRAKQLLEMIKASGKVVDMKQVEGLCEFSGASDRYANVLTGIRMCHDFGADIKGHGGKLLGICAGKDQWGELTERLIQYGADPKGGFIKSKAGLTAWGPISTTVAFNKKTIVAEIYLKNGASPDVFCDFGGYNHLMRGTRYSPLMTAAAENRKEFIPILLKYKAKVDLRCPEDGMTALHLAARWNSAEIVTLLLAAKADRRLRDKKGMTALAVARKFKAKNAIKALEAK